MSQEKTLQESMKSVDADDGTEKTLIRVNENENEKELEEVVHELKLLDSFLHSTISTPPTAAELNLYGLILGHVRFCILLYQREKSASDHRDHKIRLLEAATALGSMENGENLLHDVFKTCMVKPLDQFHDILDVLKDFRLAISSTLASNTIKPGGESMTKKRKELLDNTLMMPEETNGNVVERAGVDSREVKERLFSVLQTLERMRRARSYAPPAVKEVVHYREIRKCVTSSLSYIRARHIRQRALKEAELNEGYVAINSTKSDKNWFFILQFHEKYGVSYAPYGHRFAVVLDELPELLSTLKDCVNQSSDIYSQFSRPKYVDLGMGDIITRGSDEKEISNLCLRKSKIHRLRHSDQKLDEILEVKTREKLILQMLDAFKKLRSSNSSNHLTVEEMRLYMLMDEHIYLSLWVSGSGRQKPQGYTEVKSDEVTGCNLDDGDTKSREEYLQEILRLIETVELAFVDTPPTAQELVYYNEMEALIRSERGRTLTESRGRSISAHRDAVLRYLSMSFHERELKWAKDLGEEYGRMIKIILPWLPSELNGIGVLHWTDENKAKFKDEAFETLREMITCLPELECLDNLMTILTKAKDVGMCMWLMMHIMHQHMNYHIENNRDTLYFDEMCTLSQICEGFSLLPDV